MHCSCVSYFYFFLWFFANGSYIKTSNQTKRLVQEVALLKAELEEKIRTMRQSHSLRDLLTIINRTQDNYYLISLKRLSFK